MKALINSARNEEVYTSESLVATTKNIVIIIIVIIISG